MERRIKIAHEAPKSFFKTVQSLTDYDYFLANVLDVDAEYLTLAKKAIASGREVILDNGVFETGEALDMSKFADWVRILKPTYYIVPDVLEDCGGTTNNMKKWMYEFENTIPKECKKIGVVHGRDYCELCECYQFMDQSANCDKIAFSFDLKCYEDIFPHSNKLVSWCFGRVQCINKMMAQGYFQDSKKPLHLLGCSLPVEFQFYTGKLAELIDSVDTSNPVVLGMYLQKYPSNFGPREKVMTKLYTMINSELTDKQKDYILTNLKAFRNFCTKVYFK